MAHGKHCDCMMCSVGKKVGMIDREHEHDEEKHERNEACSHCGDKSGTCGCG